MAARKKTTKKSTSKKKTSTRKRSSNSTSAKRGSKKKSTRKKATSKKTTSKPTRTGVLDAAVEVLRDAKEPMRSKEMVEAMLDRKLWSTNGKTPHATLYAAILREILNKGKDSRFKKVDRGRFQLAKGA